MAWEDEIITGNNQPEFDRSDQEMEKEYNNLKDFMREQGLDLEKDEDLSQLQQIRGEQALPVERGADRKAFLRNLIEGIHSGNVFFRKEGEQAPSQLQRKEGGKYTASEPLDRVQPPRAMGSMKKPNIFIRVLNSLFGVFQKRMDAYNAQKIPVKPNIFVRKLNQWFGFFKKRMNKYNQAMERYRANTNTMSRYESLKKIFLSQEKKEAGKRQEKAAGRSREAVKTAPEALKAEPGRKMAAPEPEKTAPGVEKPAVEEGTSLQEQVKDLQEQVKTMQEQMSLMQEQMQVMQQTKEVQQSPVQNENRMTGYRRQQPQREEYAAPVEKRTPKKDRTETTAGLPDAKQQLREIEQMQQAIDGISPDTLRNTLIVAAMADNGGDLENVFDYARGRSVNPEKAKKILEASGQKVENILQENDRDGMARMLAGGLRNTLALYESNKLMNANAVIQGRCCREILNVFRDNPEFAQIASEKYGFSEELQTLARGAAYGAELYGKGLQAKETLQQAAAGTGKWIDNVGGLAEAGELSLQVLAMETVQTDKLSHYLQNRENPGKAQQPTEFQKYLGRSESREQMEQKLTEKLKSRMGDERILTTFSNKELQKALENPNPTKGFGRLVGERKAAIEKRKTQLTAETQRKQIAAPEIRLQSGSMSAGR